MLTTEPRAWLEKAPGDRVMILPSEREHLIWERLYCPSEPVLPLTQRGKSSIRKKLRVG